MKKEIEKWLKSGKQSKITPEIKKIVSNFNGNDFDKIIKILEWIENNIHSEEDRQKVHDIFATRTAEQLILDKNDTGCHDTALILVTLLRTAGIPAKYVLGIDRLVPHRGGHCVAEAYVKNRWMLIDPSYFQLNLIPSRSSFYKNNYVLGKGLDSWDLGVKTMKDWKTLSSKLIKHTEKFKV